MPLQARRWLARGLFLLGAGFLLAWLCMALEGPVFRASLGWRLDRFTGPAHAHALVDDAIATRQEAAASGLIGRIEIPRVGLSALVLEGTAGRTLFRGVGHVASSAFPGERGNVALAGHRDTHFRPLKDVAPGDLITLRTPDGDFVYQIVSTRVVDPDRGDLLAATSRPELTLVTCYPFYWVGPAPRRFVVRARPYRPAIRARPVAVSRNAAATPKGGREG